MIHKPPPFKGLYIRIPIIVPTNGRGFINQGSQSKGPLLVPLNGRCRDRIYNKRDPIILRTTQVSTLHHYLDWGPGTVPPAKLTSERRDVEESSAGFWVLELGTHKALSNEPMSLLRRTLGNYEVAYQSLGCSFGSEIKLLHVTTTR